MYRLSVYSIVSTIIIVSAILWNRVEAQNFRRNNRIVGGSVVNETQAGWHVAIVHKKELVCSGSLIRNNVVLTAASCVKDFKINKVVVKAGNIAFKSNGQIRKICKITLHPDFETEENTNNIALIKLCKRFNSNNSNIETLHIPNDKSIELPSALSILGWGVTGLRTKNVLTKKIRISKFKVYSDRKCLQYLPDRDRMKINNVFCLGDRTKRVDICNDDIGSAVLNIRYKKIYGIVSTSGACTENRTIIATSLIPHISWIESNLNECKFNKSTIF